MFALTLTALVLLGQDATEPATEPPADTAPSSETTPKESAGSSEKVEKSVSSDPALAALRKQAEELARQAAKLKTLTGPEREKALDEIRKKAISMVGHPVVPPSDYDINGFFELSDSEQALVISRSFFEALLSGDAGRVVEFAGFPFLLEDKKVERADELRTVWAKHLRSKRTDLLALYGIEVFTPAELEKRYGPPPQRLKNWPSKHGAQSFMAVANLSGRAAVVCLRPFGSTWQVVAYHD